MPDPPAGGQAPPVVPPGGQVPPPEPIVPPAGDDLASLSPSVQKMISDLRAEAAGNRVKATEAEKKIAAFEKDKLSETDKLKLEAKEASEKVTATEQRLRDTNTRLAIERAARKLNIVDEDVAYKLLDRDKIKFNDDGEPQNVVELLTALATEKPFLVATQGSGGASGGGSANPGKGGNGVLTMDDVKKMSREQIQARREDVEKALQAARK